MRRLLCVALATCFCAHATAATRVQQDADVPKVVVDYGDLNTQDVRGVKVLYGRLKRAATAVCVSYEVDRRDLAKAAVHQACRTGALTRAIDAIGNPLLTRYAAERQKARPASVALN